LVDAASAINYKTYFKRTAYHLKAWVLGTRGNGVLQYRAALQQMLSKTGLKDSVLFISADKWNKDGWQDTSIFLRDRIHLNMNGYQKLDSCLAVEIVNDWKKRR